LGAFFKISPPKGQKSKENPESVEKSKTVSPRKAHERKTPIKELEEEVKNEVKNDAGEGADSTCTIYSWNVNGIRAVIKDGSLAKFMQSHKPAVLCLNETKIDDDALRRDNVIENCSKWFPKNL
jgi:hypothetical protein